LDAILGSQKGINDAQCQTESANCNTQMSMTDIVNKVAPQFGAMASLFGQNNQADICAKKEDPNQELSFSKIQALLSGNFQSALQSELKAQLKAQCQKQFDEEKQKCDTMKKALCSALSGGDQSCLLAMVSQGIAKSSAAKAGGDACQQLSNLVDGEKVNTGNLAQSFISSLGTSAVASNVANGGGAGLAKSAGALTNPGNAQALGGGLALLNAFKGK